MSDLHWDHVRPPGWHARSKNDVEQVLQTGPDGLTDDEARRRVVQYGSNRLTPPARRGPLLRLVMQFHNILLYVMLGAAIITAVLGQWVDTGALLAAVVINAIIGFIHEGKAEAALDAVRAMLSPHATVIRGGHRHEFDAGDLVPGDWVILTAGHRIPADLRLVSVRESRIEEAALTDSRGLAGDHDRAPGARGAARWGSSCGNWPSARVWKQRARWRSIRWSWPKCST